MAAVAGTSTFHAQWTSGAKEQAIARAKVHVRTYPRHMLGQVELARMLSRSGEDLAAALHAHAVEELAADQNASTLEISLAADLLRELLGCNIDPELVCFYIPAYMAFHLGHFRLAARDAADAVERDRLVRHAECAYERPLRAWLEKRGGAA